MLMGSSISLRGWIDGSYPVQWLVIEPNVAALWNVFWILGRVLESGYCFWILGNVLSLQTTVLSSSLFFPSFFFVVVVSLALFSFFLNASLG